MADDALLEGSHALAAGRPARAALRVPGRPSRISVEIVKPLSRPVAVVQFIDSRNDLDRETAVRGQDAGGLQAAALRARLNQIRAGIYRIGAVRDLLATQLVERDAFHPAAQGAAKQGVTTVTHEMYGSRHHA
jgi:hypothetical protein